MRVITGALLAFAAVLTAAAAQSPDALLTDTRLTVHTLVREDVFAGFLSDNTTRLSKAEQNLETLLRERPGQRANILAWKAGATLYRAVVAHEAGKPADFEKLHRSALALFDEASKGSSGNDGVAAITGGTLSIFADRLPEPHRARAWKLAHETYTSLWRQQGPAIEQLPVHHKGELLAGLAQSAQRTGRDVESAEFVDRILTLMPNTPYETTARQWKTDPASAKTTNLTCKNCHNPGRLSARVGELSK